MTEKAPLYSGKAKSVYRSETDHEYLIEFRDDITAFDGGKKDELQGKGSINAKVSAFIFRLLERNGIDTHFLKMEDNGLMRVKELKMLPLEIIVRNVAAGSVVRNYPFTEGKPFHPPIIVIDYKDDSLHDPMLNDELIIALDIITSEELTLIKKIAHHVNSVLKSHLEKCNLTLVDFKLEFGWCYDKLTVGDEISMDSMRIWEEGTRKSLDKDVYRFEKGDVMTTYHIVAQRIITDE